ncbi:hypothetical protein R3P38DRAFT_2838601 [Favolaschia claudopus]|uniref:Ricin B lectin domain-containing protein n=1 Tax=Favolaschia claudopus TaxID=2862362 RepID=A0AAW0E986_9AGAR
MIEKISTSLIIVASLVALPFAAAADILIYKISDFQGRMVDLANGNANSLTPVHSYLATGEAQQNWQFIFAAHGDTGEYFISNAGVPSSALSYSTAILANGTAEKHVQIVGNRATDVRATTFWELSLVDASTVSLREKKSGLAMTAWPAGESKSSPLTLEEYNRTEPRQKFFLV